jgi:hypothetical protein
MTKATDSTVFLYWGNDNLKRRYHFDVDLSSAEKRHIKWTSKNYLILEYGTGSGVWVDIALPIDKKEKPQEFVNGVCFDKTSNLFASEGYDDTILIVKNLKTKKEQFIIEKNIVVAVIQIIIA